jgi:hypothetical protein
MAMGATAEAAAVAGSSRTEEALPAEGMGPFFLAFYSVNTVSINAFSSMRTVQIRSIKILRDKNKRIFLEYGYTLTFVGATAGFASFGTVSAAESVGALLLATFMTCTSIRIHDNNAMVTLYNHYDTVTTLLKTRNTSNTVTQYLDSRCYSFRHGRDSTKWDCTATITTTTAVTAITTLNNSDTVTAITISTNNTSTTTSTTTTSRGGASGGSGLALKFLDFIRILAYSVISVGSLASLLKSVQKIMCHKKWKVRENCDKNVISRL